MIESTIPELQKINSLNNEELIILFEEFLALPDTGIHPPESSLFILSNAISKQYKINPVHSIIIVNQHLAKIAANSFIQQNK